LKGQVRARVALHLCDSFLAPGGPWIYEPWEPLTLPAAAAGGGGTDFRPVFAWLDARGLTPAVLLYFTDGLGEFPAAAPSYPVAWLVKGSAPVPWGERIQLND
jgi:predicted metal-dependent peptidase